MLAALARSTTRIGLIATASTTYSAPYDLARRFSTVDHLSGWNIVTTRYAGAAGNFGLAAHAAHEDRYDRAEEFVEVVSRLWESSDADAVVNDQDRGVWADTDLIRPVDFHGRFFDVSGALTLPRSPGPSRIRPGGLVLTRRRTDREESRPRLHRADGFTERHGSSRSLLCDLR